MSDQDPLEDYLDTLEEAAKHQPPEPPAAPRPDVEPHQLNGEPNDPPGSDPKPPPSRADSERIG